MAQVKIVDVDVIPLCPLCDKPLDRILRICKGFLLQSYIFVCPHCNKVLSIGSNLGS